MAIRIPSKNIYGSPENPKVRDNVIERIEVGAVEVLPDNEYETPVYNETLDSGFSFYESISSDKIFHQITIDGYQTEFWYAYHWISPQYIKNISIKIPKIKTNKWVNKIYTGVKEDKEEKSEEIPYIGVTIRATKETGTATGSYPLSSKPTTNYTKTEDYTGSIKPKKTYTYTHTISGSLASKSITTPEKWVNQDNINTATYTADNDFYYLNLTILCGYEEIGIGGYNVFADTSITTPTYIPLSGECEKYTGYRVEITIYGNTIGIDLTDKTVYINGKTAKKVHSVDGNELMQTSNYFLESGNSAITTMYGETATQYARGKETATIRCSISDYYQRITAKVVRYEEYSATNIACYFDVGDETLAYELIGEYVKINGIDGFVRDGDETQIMVLFTTNKVIPFLQDESVDLSLTAIAVDNSTNKMCFEIGDQVIPMVYGADGKDHPMSTYQNGSPKIFQVLGSKIFYDGAVWQELSLQEVDKSENL